MPDWIAPVGVTAAILLLVGTGGWAGKVIERLKNLKEMADEDRQAFQKTADTDRGTFQKGATCLFRRSRPPIPGQAVHRFRAKPSGLER